MTNLNAIIFATIIVLAAIADAYFGWGIFLFLGRKMLQLIETLAFWR